MGKVTLQDVAKAAGVSIATASWAVNDNKNVRIPEATRRKVRKVADRLGYHSNALARGLSRGSAPTGMRPAWPCQYPTVGLVSCCLCPC